MSTIKYKNGMYKSTSPSQENVASKLFSFMKLGNPDCTMGYNLNQFTGELGVNICSKESNLDFTFSITRTGKIIS
jgi:hypothetical protein